MECNSLLFGSYKPGNRACPDLHKFSPHRGVRFKVILTISCHLLYIFHQTFFNSYDQIVRCNFHVCHDCHVPQFSSASYFSLSFRSECLLEHPVSKHIQSNFFSRNEESSLRLTHTQKKKVKLFSVLIFVCLRSI